MENDTDKLKKYQQHLVNMLEQFSEFCDKNELDFFLVGGSALGAYRHDGFIPWDDDIDIAMLRGDFEKMEQYMSEEDNMLKGLTYSPVEHAVIPEAPIGHLYDFRVTSGSKEYAPKIDIHPLDGVPEEKYKRTLQKICALIYYLGIYHLPVKNKGKIIHWISKMLLNVIPDSVWKLLLRKTKEYCTKWNTRQSKNICSLFGVAGYEKEVMPLEWIYPLKWHKFEQTEYCVPGDRDNYLTRLYGNWKQLPNQEERKPVHKSFLYFKEE